MPAQCMLCWMYMKTMSIPVEPRFRNQEECRKEARRILEEELICGMSELELAKELRFHALVYYFCESTGLFPELKAHADPINLNDHGDTAFRKAAYHLLWLLDDEETTED